MAAHSYIENEGGVTTYIFLSRKSNHTYVRPDQYSAPLRLLLLYFYLNDVGLAYANANANADVDDACSDADASA